MGIQDDMLQRIVANAESMLPLQKEQLQFGLDTSRVAYQQAQDDRDWMIARRGVLGALQDQLATDAKTFNTEARREELAAEAASDVRQAFGTARDTATRQLTRYGVNPTSGAFAKLVGETSVQEALAEAGAKNTARAAARQEGYALTDRATNALAGYPAMGMQATGAGAGYAAQGIGLANAGLAGMNSGFGSAAQIAGQMGTNATGMYGQQASYKSAQDKLAQDDGGFMGFLGTLGGAAITKMPWSDPRLKERAVPLGRDERTGLTIWEFNYVGQPDRRYRGVMADEVAQVLPEAVGYDDHGFAMVDYGRLGIEFAEVN